MSDAPLILWTDYGRLDYAKAWEWQREIHNMLVGWKRVAVSETRQEAPAGALLFVEHAHVYTMGKSGSWQNLVFPEQVLADKGIQRVQTDRGGDITYHGPGQLVGYPVIDLERFGLGVAAYIDALEQVIIEVAAHFGVRTHRVKGRTGVWSGNNKVCALGIKCSRYISMHGFALNVDPDLEYFKGIVPCGLHDGGVTSLQREVDAGKPDTGGTRLGIAQVAEQVRVSFARVFGAVLQPARDHGELLGKFFQAGDMALHKTHPPG